MSFRTFALLRKMFARFRATQKVRRRNARLFRRGEFFEGLEGRQLLATLSASGTTLNLGINVRNQAISVVSRGSTYTFTLSGGATNTWTGTAAGATASKTVLTVTAANFTTINITDAANITGAGLTFENSGKNTYASSINATLSYAPKTVDFYGTSSFTGSTGISITTARDIFASTILRTVNGNIALSANMQAQAQTGNFDGIHISSSTIQATGTGNITFAGKAGGGFSPNNSPEAGVYLTDATISVTSGNLNVTGTGGFAESRSEGVFLGYSSSITSTTGTIVVNGQARLGETSENRGVELFSRSTIQTVDGEIRVTGTGGGDRVYTDNQGVIIHGLSSIIATGTGSIAVAGQGGNSTGSGGQNWGVAVYGDRSAISSKSGSVSISGTSGGGTGSSNNGGVFVSASGSISTDSGVLSVTGTGSVAATLNENRGVLLSDSGSITTSTGTISVSGTGGGTGTGANNYGVSVQSGGSIFTAGAGTVTVLGQGGTRAGSGGGNVGVMVSDNANTKISSGTGFLTIRGTGGGGSGSGSNYGVWVKASGVVTTAGANMSVSGTGGGSGGGGDNNGVYVTSGGQINATGGGANTINGTGGLGTGGNSLGVYLTDANSRISTASGNLAVSGTGGTAGTWNNNIGVGVTATATLTSGTGRITVNGWGGGAGASANNNGIALWNGGSVTGQSAVVVSGTGGNTAGTGAGNYGIQVTDTNSRITTSSDSIIAIGRGGGGSNSNNNFGISLTNNGSIMATGTGGVRLNISGTGGGSGNGANNYGVSVASSGAITASGTGDVTIDGRGGNTSGLGSGNVGVYAANSGRISSATGVLRVSGTGGGGSGSSNNHGVWLVTSGRITSTGGNVMVFGTGGGAGMGANNYGVALNTSSSITATGSGTLTVTGRGGNTTGSGAGNAGVYISDSATTQIASAAGALSVTGTGGGSATVTGTGGFVSGANSGVVVTKSGLITSTGGAVSVNGSGGLGDDGDNKGVTVSAKGVITSGGTGTVTVTGTGSNTGSYGYSDSDSSNSGVYITDSGSKITSSGGNVNVTGRATTRSSNGSGKGVVVQVGEISAGGNGSVTVSGTGSSPLYGGEGIYVADGYVFANGSGPVSLAGQGDAGPGYGNNGIHMYFGKVWSGTGTLTLSGSGGGKSSGGSGSNGSHSGVILDTTCEVTSKGGNIVINGTGGGVAGAYGSYGVQIDDESNVIVNGIGSISITGTGGIGNDSIGLSVDYGSQVVSSGGSVNLTGVEGTGTDSYGVYVGNYDGNYPSKITTSATNGTVRLTANSILIDSAVTISAPASGSINILPFTAGVGVNLGSTTDPIGGPLSLSNAEMATLSAGTINIGNATSGQVTVSQRITVAGNANLVLGSSTATGVSPTIAGADITLATGKTLSFASGTPLSIAINGTTVDTGYNQLRAAGTIDLNGLTLKLTGSFTPVAGNVFTIVSGTSVTGTFTGLANGSSVTLNGRSLQVNYTATSVTLTATAPVITTQPAATSVNVGGTAIFTAAASGTPTPTVQWQVSTNGTTWTNITGATSTTYSVAATTAINNTQYRAVFTNTYGTATTSAARLTVTGVAPSVTTQPSSTSVNAGATATFTAAATGTPAPTVQWQVAANQPSGTFLGQDTTTQGTWKGAYGADGYYIANDSFQKPSYANVTFQNNLLTTWNASTTDTRALQKGAAGSTDRIASCYYADAGKSFTINVNFTDGQAHRVSLYTLDWEPFNRTDRFEVLDSSGATLDSRTLSSFSGGIYLTWVISGSAQIKVTGVVSHAVVSGVFFDNLWTNIPGATSTTYTTPATTAANNGSQYRAVFTNAVGTATTATATLTVNAAPVVTTNPNSTTVIAGETATFTAAATGTPTPAVKWQVNTTGTWSDINGATGLTYSFATSTASNAAQYRAVFTNSVGTVNTTAATLTVNSAPVVSTQPSSTSVNVGQTASFTATATGNPAPSVWWQINTGSGWTDIFAPTCSSTTYTTSATIASNNGSQYRARFTNSVGISYSSVVTLTVNTAPTVTTNPASTTVVAGETGTFTAAATGTPAPTVQWQVNTSGTWSDINGATGLTYSFASSTANSGAQYRAVFTNSVGTVNTTAATLTVNSAPVVSSQPSSTSANAGSTASFAATATGNPAPSTQWQVSTNNGQTWVDVSGATSSSYSFTTNASNNGSQYRAKFTNSVGTVFSSAASLTVNVAPVISRQPSNVTAFEGETATFTAAATGTPTPTVQWQVNAGSGWTNISGATSPTYVFNPTAVNNNSQYRAVFTNAAGSVNSNAGTLTYYSRPVITGQPASTTVNAGQSASFTVTVAGNEAPNVLWQRSKTGTGSWSTVLNGGAVSGGTTTYQFTATAADDGFYYRATFSNSSGNATSQSAFLTVQSAPAVTRQPTSLSLIAGASAEFTATASGNPTATVQWQTSTDGTNWSNISGATSTTYGFTTSTANNGSRYRAVFTNSLGSVTTNPATLSVQAANYTVTQNPQSQTVTAGSTVSFSAAASGTPAPGIQWQVSPDGVSWSNISGATAGTYTFTASAADDGSFYQAVFSGTLGSAVSSAATLAVQYAPSITTQPTDSTVSAGSTATFSAVAVSNPIPTVQWQVKASGASTWANISGATSTTYSFNTSTSDNGAQYQAVFTNTVGSTTTSAVSLTVQSAPSISAQPADTAVGVGGTASFTATAAGNPAPTVQWQVSTDRGQTWSDITGATSTTYSFTATGADNGSVYQAVFTNSLGTIYSTEATLTVQGGPVITTQPTSVTVPVGSTATFTAAATGTPAPTVQWQVKASGASTWTNIPGATATTYSFNTSSSDNGAQYQAVFTNAAGNTTTSVASLTVQYAPSISAQPADTSVGVGGTASFTATADANPAATVQWQVSTDNGQTWSDITGATSTTYSFTATGADNGTVYQAVFTNSLGVQYTTEATLTVQGGPVITTQPTSVTVPVGSTATFTAAATGTPAPTVQWQVKATGASTWATIPGATDTTYSFNTSTGDNGAQYQAVFTNAVGNTITSVASLTVQYAPSITGQPADTTVGVGGTASFTATADANPAATVQWQVSSDGGLTWSDLAGATSTTYSFTASSADDGTVFQAVFTNLLGTQYTTEATLTVQAAPTITISPVDTSVPVGATATFTVAASGDPTPSVQWQVKASGASTWSDIAGATDTTYSLDTSLSDDGSQYRAVFTNTVGTATTAAATLSLAYAPSVTLQPADTTVNAGGTATFTAAATGSPAPTVQWFSSTDSGVTWNPINGATSATYSFTASPSDDGSIFQAVFTNSQGNQVTQDAWLTVNYAPIITTQPADMTVAVDGLASFTVAASSNPVATVQWFSSTDGGSNWSPISGATDTTYSLAASGSDNGTQYQAVLTNAAGSTTSSAATLLVQVAPSITTQPVSVAVIAGQTATFTAAATGTPTPTVQWYSSTDDGATWNAISGATSTTYSFTVAEGDSGNLYHAVFTNAVASQATDEATLTVNTGLVITTQPTDQVVQEGYEAIFTAAATGTPEPTVQWYSSTDGGSTWNPIPDATDTTLSFAPVATDNGTQYQAVFTSVLGTVTTTAATLTVQYAPSVTSDPASTTVNAGATASFTATANANPAATVQWQVSTDDGLSWTDISGATSTTYSLTTSAGDDGTMYQAVFTNAVGSVTSQSAELTVQYIVVTSQPVSQTVNQGDTATFTATATGTPIPTVQWQKSSNGGNTWTDIGGATSTSYTTPATVGADDGTQYRAVFTNNSGTVASTAATLVVHNYAPIVTGNPTTTTVNQGDAATFTATANANPAPTVQWQISTNGGTTWTNISGANSTSYTTSATTAGNDGTQYRAVFMNSLGSATTSAATLKVNQAPTITSQPVSVTTNSGSTATFTASATGTPTPTVQWQVNSGSGWSNISGATSTSYSVLATGNNGNQYRAVFTNTLGTVTSNAATLTIAAVATVSSTSIGWGTQTASLVDAGNGRLLPAGRVNTIPWLGVNTITLALDNPIVSLVAGDISFKSAAGLSYSVQSVSGSGTSWTITLANGGIVSPDKLTVTVSNSSLASFSKRLDVLPGDVNDDGLVSSVDQMLVSRQLTGAYIAFYDIDGSGALSSDDVSKIKSRIGNRLPA